MSKYIYNDASPSPLSIKEAKEKIYNFCAYQERTQKEVRNRLYEYGLGATEIEAMIADLISENFINEERFALSFAGGKFRIKKWGRLKIISELKSKGLSDYCLRQAIKAIDEDEYNDTLLYLIDKKALLEKEKDIFRKKNKIASYVISKGYEPDIVWNTLNNLDLH